MLFWLCLLICKLSQAAPRCATGLVSVCHNSYPTLVKYCLHTSPTLVKITLRWFAPKSQVKSTTPRNMLCVLVNCPLRFWDR